MPHRAACHLGLHYMLKYPFQGFQYATGFITLYKYQFASCREHLFLHSNNKSLMTCDNYKYLLKLSVISHTSAPGET